MLADYAVSVLLFCSASLALSPQFHKQIVELSQQNTDKVSVDVMKGFVKLIYNGYPSFARSDEHSFMMYAILWMLY